MNDNLCMFTKARNKTLTAAELAWLICTLLANTKQLLASINATQAAHTSSDSGCLSKLKYRDLKIANGTVNLYRQLPQLISTQKHSIFGHRHDALCSLYGVSEKCLTTLFKDSGCKQLAMLSEAINAALCCVTDKTYGTGFTAEQIMIAEIKARVTPTYPLFLDTG